MLAAIRTDDSNDSVWSISACLLFADFRTMYLEIVERDMFVRWRVFGVQSLLFLVCQFRR